MDAVQKANSGHPGTPMGLAPLGYVLYSQVMHHNPANPHWYNRDRFVLSAGHACMLQYACLHLSGYDLTLDDIKQFRQWQSRTPGHPEFRHTAGVEFSTGPLGQGVGNAVGFALAEAHLAAQFNRPSQQVVDHHTYFIAGDGDMEEGISSEAASLAGYLGLGKLIGIYDDNEITIEGPTDLAFHDDVGKRFESYGWSVHRLEINCRWSGSSSPSRRPSPLPTGRLWWSCPRTSATAARTSRTPLRPWLAARRGRDQADQGGPRLALRGAVHRPGRGLRALRGGQGAGDRRRAGMGRVLRLLLRRARRARRSVRSPDQRHKP